MSRGRGPRTGRPPPEGANVGYPLGMDLGRQLAEALRRMRRDAGLTQTAMAKRLGISQPTLNRLEASDQNTTLRTLYQLCQALGCGIGDLFARQIGRRGRGRRTSIR